MKRPSHNKSAEPSSLIPGKLYWVPERVFGPKFHQSKRVGRPVACYPFLFTTGEVEGSSYYADVTKSAVAMFIEVYDIPTFGRDRRLNIFLYSNEFICFERQINENPKKYLKPCQG